MKSEVIDSMVPSWRSRMNVCIYICVTAYPGVHMSPCTLCMLVSDMQML